MPSGGFYVVFVVVDAKDSIITASLLNDHFTRSGAYAVCAMLQTSVLTAHLNE